MKTVPVSALYNNPADCLIDVRLSDDHAHEHLPRAKSNCVFEVAFAERLEEQAPHKENRVVIYGADNESREATMAAEKMERLGYQNIVVVDGGIAAWKEAGHPVEGEGKEPAKPEVADGSYSLDLEESWVEWTGRNLLNKHFGTISIKSGSLQIKDKNISGGKFVIDMTSMKCSDLEGEMHDGLIGHLQSDDFFDTEKYPEAVFEIRSSERISKATPGNQNLIIRGDLTMKGVTAPVELGACAGITPEGSLAAQSSFLIDRTAWNVIYGSGKFFNRLGMHLVNDLVDIELKLIAHRA